MCGRYTLTVNPALLAALLDDLLPPGEKWSWPDFEPRYNVSPTQEAPVVRMGPAGPVLAPMRWGLLPVWMVGRSSAPLINARSETVAEKPAFKAALRHRRCLVPADGFFEWAPLPEDAPKGTRKQPYWFRRADRSLFAMAGLWEPPNAAAPLGSYTLVTTAPNATVAPVHDRMPVILPPEAYAVWLDPDVMDPAALVPLLRPSGAAMTSEPVSTRLNASRGENDPTLLRPDPPPPPPPPDLRLF